VPAVTIGLPTYNRATHLREAVRSILSQSWDDFELIVCDDASPDDTERVVKEFTDERVRYFRNENNLGIPGNLNRILGLAGGDHILFLHDHDLFRSDLVESMLLLYKREPDLGFVHPGVAWVDPDGGNYTELLSEYEEVMDGRKLVEEILLGESFSCPVTACSMVSRKAYEAVGFRYDPRFGFLSDVDLWLRLAARFRVGYVRRPLLVCRRREEGHEFGKVNWKLVDWAADIHRENIERFFRGDRDRYGMVLSAWKRKKENLTVRSVVASLACGDLEAFRIGVERLREECSGVPRLVGASLHRVPFFHPALLGLTGVARRATRGRSERKGRRA
jgi:glycosyltransferase involved in cell wall biosynthesis